MDLLPYLKVKYYGLIPEDMPTLKMVRLLSSEIKSLPRNSEQRKLKIKEKKAMLRKYNDVMQYWQKLQ